MFKKGLAVLFICLIIFLGSRMFAAAGISGNTGEYSIEYSFPYYGGLLFSPSVYLQSMWMRIFGFPFPVADAAKPKIIIAAIPNYPMGYNPPWLLIPRQYIEKFFERFLDLIIQHRQLELAALFLIANVIITHAIASVI